MPADDGGVPRGLRHDLLNALNAVRGYAELLVADLPPGQNRDWAGRVLAAAAEAVDLAERLPRSPSPSRPAGALLLAARADRASLIPALEAAGWEVAHAFAAREAASALRVAPAGWAAVLVDEALPEADTILAAARAAGLRTVSLEIDRAGAAGAVRALAGAGDPSR